MSMALDITQMPMTDAQKGIVEAVGASGSIDAFVDAMDLSPLQKTCTDAFLRINSDPELQASFQEGMAREMTKTETRQFLDKELGHLTRTVLDTKRNFENVANTITQFDAHKARMLKHGRHLDPSKNDVTAAAVQLEGNFLLPKWRTFQETFDELLDHSKRTAKDGVYEIKYYREVILKMASNPTEREDAIKELEGFIEKVSALNNGSDRLKYGFDRLRSEISSFKTSLDIAIQDTASDMDEVNKETQSKIEEIKTELTRYQTMAMVGWLCGAGGVAGAAGIGCAVGLGILSMTPWGWVAAASAILGALGLIADFSAEGKKTALNNEREKMQNNLNMLTDELRPMKALFKTAEGQVSDIANSISIIARIWSIFEMDANTLKKALEGTRTARTNSGLVHQVEMTQMQWAVLQANLETDQPAVGHTNALDGTKGLEDVADVARVVPRGEVADEKDAAWGVNTEVRRVVLDAKWATEDPSPPGWSAKTNHPPPQCEPSEFLTV
ncbi:hypothetical protein R3P38DRAFT_3295584 [Favolaschia claudopus]|uniref:Uncharacterized protein n=1 Tax=Favolaschia claudopus TaxID=2862362 RepID=A0AAV9ZAB6_9AGAR